MISSRQNAKFKDIRRLRRCKDDRALLDGPKLVEEALDAGLQLESVLATPQFLEGAVGRRISLRLPYTPIEIAPSLLRELADSETPQGILAVVSLPRPGLASPPEPGTFLFLDGLQDPGNVGAIARVAEASGVRAVFASPSTVHPNHPRALRASAGSLLRLPWILRVEASAVVRAIQHLEPTWIALDAHATTSLYAFDPPCSCILVVGSEGHGLSPAVQALCELTLEIPMAKPVESLNAATATAVVLFEFRRRRSAGATESGGETDS